MKRFLSLFLVLMLMALPVAGAELPLVIDNAHLLTGEEADALSSAAWDLREAYGMDVVILTEEGLGGKTPQEYADDYYDSQGYGENGLLFLLSMEERDWYISTTGTAIYALTDYSIQKLGEEALPYLSAGDYAGGFAAFLKALPTYLNAYQAGQPIDGFVAPSGDFYTGDREEVVHYEAPRHLGFAHVLIALAIGLLAGGITLGGMVYAMNTKRPQRSANAYLDQYHLGRCRDLFLYSHVDRIPKPEPPKTGGGGGSSVHTGSSGSRHGGGGGKF